MMDSPEKAVAEAEAWLDGARNAMAGEAGALNVCCAQAIHSIIRANDALCMKFIGHKPTRHEDIPHLLRKMISQGKIKPERCGILREGGGRVHNDGEETC